ncbi:MAG: hypothetical protein ACRYFS_17655 [Janthinobacterium lividum]
MEGPKITSPDTLATIERVLEDEGPILVEQRLYRGASAPDWYAFSQIDRFMDWLETKTADGDIISVWSSYALCKDENAIAQGKCPDEQGFIPELGAY